MKLIGNLGVERSGVAPRKVSEVGAKNKAGLGPVQQQGGLRSHCVLTRELVTAGRGHGQVLQKADAETFVAVIPEFDLPRQSNITERGALGLAHGAHDRGRVVAAGNEEDGYVDADAGDVEQRDCEVQVTHELIADELGLPRVQGALQVERVLTVDHPQAAGYFQVRRDAGRHYVPNIPPVYRRVKIVHVDVGVVCVGGRRQQNQGG